MALISQMMSVVRKKLHFLRPLANYVRRLRWACYAAFRRLTSEEVLVLGDSHSSVFRSNVIRSGLPQFFFNNVTVQGATVSGLKNPNSKTQAYPIFNAALRRFNGNTVVTLLGEVDTGFVLWHKAETNGVPIDSVLDEAIVTYARFLLGIHENRRVVCVSAPLPTIPDGIQWGEVANARKDIQATQLQRTQLTLQFNSRIEAFCKEHGMLFLSLDQESIGNDGLVHDSLLNEDPSNHHYSESQYAMLLLPALKQVFVAEGRHPPANPS